MPRRIIDFLKANGFESLRDGTIIYAEVACVTVGRVVTAAGFATAPGPHISLTLDSSASASFATADAVKGRQCTPIAY